MLISTEIGVNLGICTTVYRAGWLLWFSRKMSVLTPKKWLSSYLCRASALHGRSIVYTSSSKWVQSGTEWNFSRIIELRRDGCSLDGGALKRQPPFAVPNGKLTDKKIPFPVLLLLLRRSPEMINYACEYIGHLQSCAE